MYAQITSEDYEDLIELGETSSWTVDFNLEDESFWTLFDRESVLTAQILLYPDKKHIDVKVIQ